MRDRTDRPVTVPAVPGSIPSILFVIRSLHTGGAERQVVEVAKGLVARGGHVAVAVFYPEGHLVEELRRAGIAVHPLGKRGRWDLLGPIIRLRRLARQGRFEVVHGYLPAANVLCALATLGLATRLVWGVRASDVDWSAYDRITRLTFELERCLSRRPRLIIANSAAGARFHAARGYPEARFKVVPNGIDTTRFRPDPGRRAEWRRAQGIGEGALVIAIVARLDPMKDHANFLRAVAHCADLPESIFVIVGSGDPSVRGDLEWLARSLGVSGRVRWLGDVRDIVSLFAGVDLVTSTSRFGEGFSNSIAEAMSTGVPCVATDCGDARALIGDTGIVVPIADHVALAAGWHSLLAGDHRALGARARTRIEQEFNASRLVDRTLDALRSA